MVSTLINNGHIENFERDKMEYDRLSTILRYYVSNPLALGSKINLKYHKSVIDRLIELESTRPCLRSYIEHVNGNKGIIPNIHPRLINDARILSIEELA